MCLDKRSWLTDQLSYGVVDKFSICRADTHSCGVAPDAGYLPEFRVGHPGDLVFQVRRMLTHTQQLLLSMKENLKDVTFNDDQKVLRRYNKPISQDGGVVGLKGNLATEGAIVKVAGMKRRKFKGKAKCFD